MATEYAAPFAGSTIATSQNFRDRNKRLSPNGIDADIGTNALQVADGGGGTTVTVQNGGAVVEGALYQLTSGPLSLAVASNAGSGNRFDVVCLTYDASHSPGVYCRIVQGSPGAGMPSLTNFATGVWDEPIAHYQKTPGGSITGMTDRRRFLDNSGGLLCADDATGPWFPPSPRIGQRQTFWPSGDIYRWNGTSWALIFSDTNWQNLTINSGFKYYGSGHHPQYLRVSANQVRLRGIIARNSGNLVSGDVPVTIPIGGPPSYGSNFVAATSSGSAGMAVRCDVAPDGSVALLWNTSATPAWASLDGITVDLV